MKTKKDKEYYLEQAIKGFKTLVIYTCVTKPQYEKCYKDDSGKFSLNILSNQLDFLQSWNKQPKSYKKLHANVYSEYSKNFNYTFGVRREVVSEIIGYWYDDNGKKIRFSIDEIVQPLVNKGFIKVVNGGKKFKRVDGKYEQKCWWCKKYMLANPDYWKELIDDKRYSDYTQYPKDDKGYVVRAIKIIAKWRNETMKPKEEVIPVLTREGLNKMLMAGGITIDVFASIEEKVFNTPKERIETWCAKWREKYPNGINDTTTTEQQDQFIKLLQNKINEVKQ